MDGMVDQVTRHECPKCKHVNVAKGRALTIALTCEKCKIYFCVHTDAQDQFHTLIEAILPVGSGGAINGHSYRVMGFSVKRERKYRYTWHEYFLYSPEAGIAFLSTNDGHWNFLKPYSKHPWSFGSALPDPEIEEGTFKLYAKYKADVIYASGEFFTDIIDSTVSSMHYEHICPPHILNLEDNDHHISAYLGEYMTPASVASAFNLQPGKLPKKKGFGYTQPYPVRFDEETLIRISGLAAVILIALQLIFAYSASNQKILQGHFDQADLKADKMFKTASFELAGGTKNVEVYVDAPVSNDWFFGEFSLINEATGEEYIFTKEIEYYSGYEGGESWSEGSTRGAAFLSSIPEGKYHINIYPEFSPANRSFEITVYRDVSFSSNFWVLLLGLAAFPVGYFIYKHHKERSRWRDSDFSPYTYEE
ncbi:hypothetical protein WSM22_38970 [Cytophagales bacterium WSM2-2]|nr:hypothetical protein WSM22_38970 [Cytophagales bacterium WSM2-2]